VPKALQRGQRCVWLSLLSYPVHGWHVQQILKIAGVLAAPEERVCIIDSDILALPTSAAMRVPKRRRCSSMPAQLGPVHQCAACG